MVAAAFWVWQSDLARLLAQTGWLVRIVLLILVVFSILSWAIIYRMYASFRRANRQTDKFLESFRAAERLPEARPLATAFPASPLVAVYAAGMKELQSQVGGKNPNPRGIPNPTAISATLQTAAAAEITQLERWMTFLATTGSVTPFVGLFGTVWGIIDAFMGLGEAGGTSLRAVAPGIAEALIATAAGLFAAIPAVIAYNHFLSQIRRFAARMDNFAVEFLARAEKLYA
ncbi:MAG: MotA/TolQ/ExbB proton channel family protein [Acidobacteria bacterium]|nr:MotA/TolQ/ExbB proton channel family protein [Acidobacteriota bacterium]